MPSPPLGRLALGAAGLGNLYAPMSDEQAYAVLEAAWDCGVRYFDTAPHYGLGLSERRLGVFLASKPRGEYVVSTKVGRLLVPDPGGAGRLDEENAFAVPADHRRVWDFSADGIRRSLEDSLTRLGLDAVDIVYLHDPELYDLEPALAEGVPAVVALRDEGLVRAVGVGSKCTKALAAAARTGLLDLVMVAGRFTLLEQPALDDVLPECRAHSVGVVAAAVFNSGLLATPSPSAQARYEYEAAPPEVLARAREIAAVCAEFGVELPTAALQYPLRDHSVRSVVVGAASPWEVRENSTRLQETVPGALWTALRERGLVRA
ncbi:D-threo-aldose 1-dehydrogenase [Amycolatopsis bartoniae]|uniref:Oxidoreductase aryl-alcohol dehydrogenase like protein n=1 Tax=Amycolatopsis bartoniae TaxID=941986 RepID=A0A8H9ITQ9_9PSEU|nr:aldo/keto reductase [Amycolatopsis bartoniae]MBB2937807.1 D-threo-aldose 1-dehydrogenase [Amycolatopsis bartoniae]TVT06526.1 aldo/keto reductase [Amycolatopsis bartoniae]GHF40851.1 oxidoreductase aryl-alcohol dehydrogenase like protein [Amycolatopsis bartoniae]